MSKIDQVAELLFIRFQKEFPLPNEKGPARATRSLSQKVIDQRLDRFYEEAHEVRKQHHLWVIGWARVVLKLQQRLLLAGYPPEGVKPLLLGMLITTYGAK